MKAKRILNIFAILITSSILVSLLCSCFDSENKYLKSVGYYCENEEFKSVYFEFYSDKIEELKSKYGLECEKMIEIVEEEPRFGYKIYLYNDIYTIEIKLINGTDIAHYSIKLYFYGESELDLDKYEKQENLVNFINDFTDSVAYDTKTDINHFQDLYNKLKQIDKGSSYEYWYYFDRTVEYVGYKVVLSSNRYSYYYKMLCDDNIDIKSNLYEFDGLLKPLNTNR